MRKLHPSYLLLAALLISSAAAQAQGVRLSAVLDMALESDAQFGAALAAADGARERLPQALAGTRPSISLSANTRRNRDGSTAYNDTLSYVAESAAINYSQPLFRLGIKANVEQAEALERLADQQLAFARQDLLMRVARAYFDVLQAADELTTAGAQKDALTQQLAQTRRGFEVGTVPITDVNEAQARHDIAIAQQIVALNELESRKRILERSIVRPLPPLARLKDRASAELLSAAEIRELVGLAPRSALSVLIARAQVAVAEKEIAKREAGHHATLDLVGSVSASRNVNVGQFGGNNTRQASIGFEFGFPIYQGGVISSRTREAMADRRRAEHELAQAERQATLDAQQAQLGVQSGIALTSALRQALISTESQLRSSVRGQQVGIRTRVDVLNAEQQVFATRRDLAVARYRTLVAALQLKAAAGLLTEADLRGLDGLLAD